MTVGIHALYIAHVVTLLGNVSRSAPCACAHQASPQQAAARTDRSAWSSPDRRPRGGAKSGSYSSACHTAGCRSLIRRRAASLLNGELSALIIISTKLLEAFAGAGQNHYARP